LMRHHMDQHAVLGRPVHSRIDSLIARTADHVIVPSQAVGDYLQDHEGVRGDSITVCPLGFDFSVLERSAAMGPQLRGELGLNDAFLVGYVGRLVPEKGVDSLLRAVTELRPDHPQLRILLVGEEPGGWLQPEIRSLGLSDEVTVLGHRPDGPAYIAALDLLVHPSLTDSFPQTLIEAQAVGTPVVATTVGGIPEIVTHDLTGLLVRPDEPAELAQAIRCLAADALQRERLATTAQKHAREAFPVERMVSDHLSVYLKCIAGK